MLSVGIVGLPNVGKSTLFSALTKKQVPAENFPFCTIDPNVGVVEVPDERLAKLAALSQSEKIIPTAIEFVDIAGLVAGAHQGEGLGNKFLSHIREVNAICQVVRVFTDPNVIHVSGSVDAKRDYETINLELAMADLATVTKRLDTVEGKARSGDKLSAQWLELLKKLKGQLDAAKPIRSLELTDDEQVLCRELNLLTAKPMLLVVNADEQANDAAAKLSAELGVPAIAISAKLEAELVALPPAEAQEFLESLGWNESGLDRLITAAYKLLNLITFLTTGPKETRAWTVGAGAKAPQAAAAIHTDFEKAFIRAEIISYEDFIALGGEAQAREQGKLRIEGKEYIIKDGDVAHFRVNP